MKSQRQSPQPISTFRLTLWRMILNWQSPSCVLVRVELPRKKGNLEKDRCLKKDVTLWWCASAIGSGTDVAIESAGLILVNSNPLDLVKIFKLSRASYNKMIQNLWWAAGYNIIAIPLAAGVLANWGILLSPAVGALLMSVSTIVVALNAQLLRRVAL